MRRVVEVDVRGVVVAEQQEPPAGPPLGSGSTRARAKAVSASTGSAGRAPRRPLAAAAPIGHRLDNRAPFQAKTTAPCSAPSPSCSGCSPYPRRRRPRRRRRGRARPQAEHRLRPHRRPRRGPDALHAERPRAAAPRHDVRSYFVTNSLCCPSRATILTGQYPHNTAIFRNTGADGGFLAFRARGAGAAHTSRPSCRRAATARADGQVPQPVRARRGSAPRPEARTCRPAGPTGASPATATRATATGSARDGARRAARLSRERLPHERAAREGSASSRDSVADGRAVHARPVDVRAARAGDPGPARQARFGDADARRATPSFDEADLSDKPALAARPPAADRGAGRRASTRRSAAACAGAGGRPRWSGGCSERLRGARRRGQHVHRLQLRQRLPPRPAPAHARQADGVRHRHPRAADRRRARACRPAARSTR